MACRGCHRPRHEPSNKRSSAKACAKKRRRERWRERERKRDGCACATRREKRDREKDDRAPTRTGRKREEASVSPRVRGLSGLVCVPCSECTEQALVVRGHLSYDRSVPTLPARLPASCQPACLPACLPTCLPRRCNKPAD